MDGVAAAGAEAAAAAAMCNCYLCLIAVLVVPPRQRKAAPLHSCERLTFKAFQRKRPVCLLRPDQEDQLRWKTTTLNYLLYNTKSPDPAITQTHKSFKDTRAN